MKSKIVIRHKYLRAFVSIGKIRSEGIIDSELEKDI